MKVNRQRKILELVNRYSIETQDDLIDRLMTEGYAVTQATISRDIRELQLTKVLTGKGTYRYVAARKEEGNTGLHFNSALIESLMSVEYAGNIIVIKTFPGLANAVAAGIDQLSIAEVLGCVAGDDTIMVVTRNEAAAKLIRERISVMVKKG
ncbi:MAG: arginine repressor [Clostridia bacterium]|nr:arginine repressor [Clostridia bacterium]MDD7700770.1 arginine repressor [Eubacteriales bacterium]MDY2827605.1 arginine repressor [Eubacteriales bacterium]